MITNQANIEQRGNGVKVIISTIGRRGPQGPPGEATRYFDSVQDAVNADPVVHDDQIFETPEGIWRRDSSLPEGAVFLREFLDEKVDAISLFTFRDIFDPSMLINAFISTTGSTISPSDSSRCLFMPVSPGDIVRVEKEQPTSVFRYAYTDTLFTGEVIHNVFDAELNIEDEKEVITKPAPDGAAYLCVYLAGPDDTYISLENTKVYKRKYEDPYNYTDSKIEELSSLVLNNVYDPSLVRDCYISSQGNILGTDTGAKSIFIPVTEGQECLIQRDVITNRFRYAFVNQDFTGSTISSENILGGNFDGGYDDEAREMHTPPAPEGSKFLCVYMNNSEGAVGTFGDLKIYKKLNGTDGSKDINILKDLYLEDIFDQEQMVVSGFFTVTDRAQRPSSSGSLLILIPVKEGDKLIFDRDEALTNRLRYGFFAAPLEEDSSANIIGGNNQEGFDDTALQLEIDVPPGVVQLGIYINNTAENPDYNLDNIRIYKRVSGAPEEDETLTSYLYGNFTGIYKSDTIEDVTVGSGYLDLHNASAADIYEKYDELMNLYPQVITEKNLLGYGSDENGNEDLNLPIYEYVVQSSRLPGDADAVRHLDDAPLILITGGVHGNEKTPPLGILKFLEQMLSKYHTDELLGSIRFNARFKIIPVVDPWGFERTSRVNAAGVELNRDFYSSSPQLETIIVQDWLNENNNAFMYIDYHNSYAWQGGPSYIISDSPVQRMVYSSLIRRLSDHWKMEYLNEDDDFVRGYWKKFSDVGVGLAGDYGRTTAKIERSGVLEVMRGYGGTSSDPSTWYGYPNIEFAVEALANYLLASLDSYAKGVK